MVKYNERDNISWALRKVYTGHGIDSVSQLERKLKRADEMLVNGEITHAQYENITEVAREAIKVKTNVEYNPSGKREVLGRTVSLLF